MVYIHFHNIWKLTFIDMQHASIPGISWSKAKNSKLTFILQKLIEKIVILKVVCFGKWLAVWHEWFIVSGWKQVNSDLLNGKILLFYLKIKFSMDSKLTFDSGLTEPMQQWVLFCCWFIDLMRAAFMWYNCCTQSNVWKLNFNWFPDLTLRRDPYLCLQSNREYHTTEVLKPGWG